jgi:MerR family transcriptional regulator, light-induced transcriptional regulator
MKTYSIGALAKASGIPANTLRTWERRYGFPTPRRTEGGHRVYEASVLERLGLIAAALAQGHRAGQVVVAEPSALRALVAPRGGEWVSFARSFDADGLDRAMAAAWGQRGALSFMSDLAAPFLRQLGEAWAEGTLGVDEEHFASGRLRAFLEARWRAMSQGATGAALLLTTLPGERHDLGLHFAAVLAASHGRRVVFLGADMPLEGTVRAAGACGAHAVLLSVAGEGAVAELRRALPRDVLLVCGGRSAPELPGVVTMRRLTDLDRWLRG